MKTHENLKEEKNEKRMREVEVLPNLRKMRAKELQMAEKKRAADEEGRRGAEGGEENSKARVAIRASA